MNIFPPITSDICYSEINSNIENVALENIISIYSQSKKQIFISIDKLSSYDKRAAQIINRHKVLQLSKDKLLFTKNWKSNR